MAAYTHRNAVMFQHCDPAGIVFYPRYYEMINAAIEHFFDEALDWPWRIMHGQERLGVPMGRITTDFQAPSRLGDWLDWSLDIRRVGGASLDLDIRATGEDGVLRVTAEATLVLVDLDRMKSRRWPDDKRARLQSFMEDAA
ncbi:acyl-CoA thioesterase [Tranquillimonas alkanivorans]|uniref:4-hydroxybenzoyl-CoA thioesterase n=1 Tax=Tranquillimonas alkanivorans TaxID=441119 RepID=A0A1I5UG29_9RHOB|nr:acyl-CoA thioesterase [Tranquillimonas alkanivorans]SFP94241.1 4-hydroxybenzoyl-CoA thioesterase [Tranquillimonas alkanivorans]